MVTTNTTVIESNNNNNNCQKESYSSSCVNNNNNNNNTNNDNTSSSFASSSSFSVLYSLMKRERGSSSNIGLLSRRNYTSNSNQFTSSIYGNNNNSTWILSKDHYIINSSTNGGRYYNNTSYTVALDICGNSRFILSGNNRSDITIYDLWEKNYNNYRNKRNNDDNNVTKAWQQQQEHSPIQKSRLPGGSSVTCARWYNPIDTGIFLTTSMDGIFTLWDTSAMVQVLTTKPFIKHQQYSNDISSISNSNSINCMDISKFTSLAAVGSHSHPTMKLIDLRSGASSHSMTANTNTGGITTVRFSPIHPNIIVSCCTYGHIWDIRKTKQPITILNNEYQPKDYTISTPFYADGSHYWKHNNIIKKKKQQRQQHTKSYTTISNFVFDNTGQKAITICNKRRNIYIWDLRYTYTPVQLNNYRFVSHHNGKPIDNTIQQQPLLLHDNMIWIIQNNNNINAYTYNIGINKPIITLNGHLGRIQAITANDNYIITSAKDGLILIWEKHKKTKEKKATNIDSKKRKKLILEDVDNW